MVESPSKGFYFTTFLAFASNTVCFRICVYGFKPFPSVFMPKQNKILMVESPGTAPGSSSVVKLLQRYNTIYTLPFGHCQEFFSYLLYTFQLVSFRSLWLPSWYFIICINSNISIILLFLKFCYTHF